MFKKSSSGKQAYAFLTLIFILHAELMSLPVHGSSFYTRTVTTQVPIERKMGKRHSH